MAAQRGPSLTTKQFVEQLFLLPPPPPPPGVDPVEEGGLGCGDGQVVDGGKNKGTLCSDIFIELLLYFRVSRRKTAAATGQLIRQKVETIKER